tara:strand:+ start:6443 stop:7600 length:1158 start_codon:yes stop_codon:yes gene_type:complete
MYRIYYAEKDTTLYEKKPERNSGVDEILELIKITSGTRHEGAISDKTYNSRILLDFGTEITALSQSIVDGDIPMPHTHSLSSSVYLNIRASDAEDLLFSYKIDAYPISESWSNGTGYYSDSPSCKIGSSWYNRSGDAHAQTVVAWDTASANSGTDGIGATEQFGGGTYIITGINGGIGSQTFTNTSPDIRMDVTHIVREWVEGVRPNYGFIVKRPNGDENNGDILGSLKFFSRESHTIFIPRLEIGWDDIVSTQQSTKITSDTYVPYIKNIKSEYRTSDIARFRVGVRPEFPTKSYQTSSFYITNERLPASSSYEIIDSVTNDIIIKDERIWGNSKTKISDDSNGSYFSLRMDSFMPERYYKIKLTCRRPNDTQTFDDFYFKVVN